MPASAPTGRRWTRSLSGFGRRVPSRSASIRLAIGYAGTADFTSWLEYFSEGILDELTRVRKSILAAAPPPRLGDHHRIVLDHIRTHGSIGQQEYGALSARSPASRKQDFARLVALGLIKSQGGGRSLYYVAATDSDGGER